MANPTTNFGWQMPTSTDLVTDLPADFEVFGQAVDTTLVDLKGGTTGQVLSKASNTDMDFTWQTQTAGMTNPMTTTGDTIYSSSGSTPARLGIGSTGQVLTVSGGVPSWATPSSTFSGCFLYATSVQTIPTGTGTAINYGGENFDTDNYHSTTTNPSRITIPSGKAGKYLFTFSVGQTTGATTGYRMVRIFKNASTDYNVVRYFEQTSGEVWTCGSIILDAVVGDYFQVYFYQTSGANMDLDSGSTRNYFQCVYLGA